MNNPSFQVAALGEIYTIDPEKWLLIDRMNLDEALAKQSAAMGFMKRLYEEVKCRREELEGDAADAEADLAMQLMDSGIKSTDRRVRLKASSEVAHHRKLIAAAKRQERLLESMVVALGQRKDCLIELMRSRRVELATPSPAELDRVKSVLRR